MRWLMAFLGIGLILFSCNDNPTNSRGGTFLVRAIDGNGDPVAGVYFEGGFDWDYFKVATAANGYAQIPEYGLGYYTYIYKDNYYTTYYYSLVPGEYRINPTPYILREIGSVDGKTIKFTESQIATCSYQGIYHLYEYSDNSVMEIASDSLPPPFKDFQLFGDTLWYSTHEDGIYVYIIDNLFHPRQIHRYEVSDYIKPFARKDTLLAIGSYYSYGPLRIFSLHSDGTSGLLCQIQNYLMDSLAFIGNNLIAFGDDRATPQIFDLSDPGNITLAYNGSNGMSNNGFISGDSIILFPAPGSSAEEYKDHRVLRIDDPRNPTLANIFQAQGRLSAIIDDTTAVGIYYANNIGLAVFRKVNTRFEAIAMISETLSLDGCQGAKPPYFIFDGRLFKLESR